MYLEECASACWFSEDWLLGISIMLRKAKGEDAKSSLFVHGRQRQEMTRSLFGASIAEFSSSCKEARVLFSWDSTSFLLGLPF